MRHSPLVGTSPARSAAQKQSFLENFAVCGTVEGAAELSGIDSRVHRTWLAKSDGYRAKFQQAQDKAIDTLITEARRRALGYQEPVWHNGRQVGLANRYSDLLLIFLIKGARPEQFRDNYRPEWAGKGPSEQHVTVNVIHEFRDSPAATIDIPLRPPDPPQLPPGLDQDDDPER